MMYRKNNKHLRKIGHSVYDFTINTKYGDVIVSFDKVLYHRHVIPCPQGEITIYDEERIVEEVLNKYPSVKSKISKSYFNIYDILENLKLDKSVRFYSCYIEFTYPRSPTLGYHLDLDWSDWVKSPEKGVRYIEEVIDDLELKVGVKELKKVIDEIENIYVEIILEAENELKYWIEEEMERMMYPETEGYIDDE